MHACHFFSSSDLHDPKVGVSRHDVSVHYDVVWLWRGYVHGHVVANVGKQVGFVVAMYVPVLLICGCLMQVLVAQGPMDGQGFRCYIVIAGVAVVLVLDHPLVWYRCGLGGDGVGGSGWWWWHALMEPQRAACSESSSVGVS